MIRLLPGQTLQAVLAGAVATLQPQATAFFSDQSASGYVGGNQLTLLNSATDVDIVAAPAASTMRDIDQLQIFNRDTAPITVTVKVDVGGVDSPILTVTLQTLETLAYAHADGWESLDANGRVKTSAFGSSQIPVQFQDEDVNLGSSGTVDTLNFTGPGIVATRAGSIITANVPVLDSFRNKIIGGDFGTNPWQRGVNFASVFSSGTYLADRWNYINISAAIVNVAKNAFAPSVAQAGRLVTNSISFQVTTADAAVAAGDIAILVQRVEGYNFMPLAQRPMTLSFWHAHSKVGTYCVSFGNAASDRSFVAEYTQSVSNAWEYTRIVISPSPAAGTWDYATGVGLSVIFTFMSGTTYQTTPGVWQTGNFIATVNQVNAMDTVGNTIFLALIQLESGTVATPFEGRSIDQELAMCQRYYEKGIYSFIIYGTAGGFYAQWMDFRTTKRATPTLARTNISTTNTTSIVIDTPDISGFRVVPQATLIGNISLADNWTADAEL